MEPALKLYDSLSKSSDLQNLIDQGECEGLFLECKSPAEPILSKDLKNKLSVAISGFSNTEGGIIIWGISTTKHEHGNLDVLSQKENMGNCEYFKKQIEKSFPTLTTPSITNIKNKIIKEKSTETKGVVITYIPKNPGDPIQSNIDNHFYFRNGDEFIKLPYEMLRRLFAATDSPELHALSDSRLIIKKQDNTWEIPIMLENLSSAVAEHVNIFVSMENIDAFETINPQTLQDISVLNPGKKVFTAKLNTVVHRGFNQLAGKLSIKMKKNKRVLKISIQIFANKMRAIKEDLSLYLFKDGVSVKKTKQKYIY